jgi:hypothetical protein
MKKYPGYFNFYWDKDKGKIWLEIDKMDQEFLYVNYLAAGLGSNDVGLDRNQLGNTRIVKFHRVGPKILLIQPNYSFRAGSDNYDERKAVEDAFAQSVIWGFTKAFKVKTNFFVDATSFFLRDAKNVIGTLKATNQGNFILDPDRSVIYLPSTKNFPQNTEIEAMLTYKSHNPGRYVRRVAANPGAITLRQHHSFVQLPDGDYKPRLYDPRSSFMALQYMDFSTPFHQSITKRYICRHRLKKKNPQAKISEPEKPIVYYVDRGVPEPISTALIEGASWWDEAFNSCGYRNAFLVKRLPQGADPLDIRFNMINWVHRSTRGWSYGSSVIDPRTGEIIKGHIALGSLRIRQDFLIAQGLIANFNSQADGLKEMIEMALLRIKQLSCHEVGHTLGLNHNYASSVNSRSSVMDYPHPLIKIKKDGNLDLTDAYTKGIGPWDEVSIAFGYQDFGERDNEEELLKTLLDDAFSKGLYYLTDQDARGGESAHPLAHLWDNGRHPTDELERVLKIRSIALNRFSPKNIPDGTPYALLEDVLVPVFLLHRYQIEACSKVLGGIYYNHSLRGGVQKLPEIVGGEEQREALTILLKTIHPEQLALDEKILNIIPPRPPGYRQSPELFSGYTGPTFDPLAAAENVANMTVGFILNPLRAARLVEYHARDKKNPGLVEVIDRLLSATWKTSVNRSEYLAEVQRVVNSVVLNRLIGLAVRPNTSPQVKAIAFFKLEGLREWLSQMKNKINNDDQEAHFSYALSQINRFLKDPHQFKITESLPAPAGSPIGM